MPNEHKTTQPPFIPLDVLALILVYANLPLRNLEIPEAKSDMLFFFNRDQLLAGKAIDLFLWGRVAESLAIVSVHPHLMTMTVEREGPAGTVKGTLYQAALWTDDKYIRDEKGKTAVEAIKELLSADEEEKQYKAQFPKNEARDWEAEEKDIIARHKAAFDAVAKAFDDSKATTETELAADVKLQEAITDFKDYLTPKEVNTSGRCCMPQLWDYTAEFYTIGKRDEYGDNSPKNDLFCCKILGTVDLRQQTWGLQALGDSGTYYGMRSKNQRADVSSRYDTSPAKPFVFGVNCFMTNYGLARAPSRMSGRVEAWGGVGFFKLLSTNTPADNLKSSVGIEPSCEQSRSSLDNPNKFPKLL